MTNKIFGNLQKIVGASTKLQMTSFWILRYRLLNASTDYLYTYNFLVFTLTQFNNRLIYLCKITRAFTCTY